MGGPMERTAISDRVRGILSQQLGLERGELAPDANLLDDLGADSLDVVELMMALEEGFDIEVPDDDVEGIRTVADIERYIVGAVVV